MLLAQLAFAADGDGQLRLSGELLAELDRHRQQIEELESEHGPFDASLLEPLEAMIAILVAQGDYEQTLQYQQRYLQLMRTALGLEHPDLIPVMRDIIPTQVALGEYNDVTDQLELIRVLSVANFPDAPEERLSVMQEQAQWYRLLSAVGESRQRARNFFRARDVVEDMLRDAEDLYGEDDPRTIPWLYELALTKQQMVGLLNADDGVGSSTLDRLITEDGIARLSSFGAPVVDTGVGFGNRTRVPIVERGEVLGQYYVREGMGKLRDIRDIYEAEGDKEGQAMARIYHGDFQLFINRGTAFRDYREARELLVEAGVPEEDIEEFFNLPQVIPLPRFFPRMSDALEYLRDIRADYEKGEEVLYLGEYEAWNDSAPMARFPMPFAGWQLNPAFNVVEVEFNISSRGRVSSVDTLSAEPDERRVRSDARRGVRDIRFRPAIIDGEQERRRDVRMRYKFLD